MLPCVSVLPSPVNLNHFQPQAPCAGEQSELGVEQNVTEGGEEGEPAIEQKVMDGGSVAAATAGDSGEKQAG